jgi:hypothetical protein
MNAALPPDITAPTDWGDAPTSRVPGWAYTR